MPRYQITDADRAEGLSERRKTMLHKRAIRKLLDMSPADRARYKPENGYEELVMLAMQSAAANPKLAITVHKEFRDTMGERQGSNWKDTQKSQQDVPDIIVDLPRPKRPEEPEELTN